MRGWWHDLTDLVLPADCGGCGRPRTVLCPECRAALHGRAPRRVRPVPEPAGLPVVHAAAAYEGAVRAILLAHKERGVLPLARPLGTALAGAVRRRLAACGSGSGAVEAGGRPASSGTGGGQVPVLLVPMPSSRRAVRARGHDPARRIAFAAAGDLRRSGTAARVAAVLRHRRAVADQAGLDARQRLANLAGALEVAGAGVALLAGGRVVLVDDLMTTGASLGEAARAVRTALADARTADTEVYARVAGEARGERRAIRMVAPAHRTPVPQGMATGNGLGDWICAAVVAASPESFEMNRD
ncbi:ComF family protein [Streptomyces chiangmaiensis]|uniref:ComF family protein n=1 Tax=Streptomyces chiangmaiensis TaxID=766497 RepID=A0ABU7FLG9_9ACTN|nr:ComF family protein [Streptomyces chiangmaiensis]MED7824678.1 ComF family protein [Streptomyces chiangmaiensis]